MALIRRGWLVMALVGGLAAPALAQAPKAPAAATKDDLAYIPADAEMVMGVQFSALQQSMLWKQLVEPQMMKGDVKAKLDEFKAICGMDPMTTVKSFTFGFKNLTAGKPEGVAVGNGVDRTVIFNCMDKLSKDAKTKAKITRTGDSYLIKGDDGSNVAVQIVGDKMIMSLGPKASIATVKAAARGTSRLKANAAFSNMYKKLKSADTVWLVVLEKSKLFDQMSGMGTKPKAVFGSVNVTRDVTADVHIRVASPKDATSFAATIKQQVAALSSFVDKIDVTSAGTDVSIAVLMSNAKVQTLIKMAGGGGGSTQAPPPPPPPPPGGGGLGAPTKKKP